MQAVGFMKRDVIKNWLACGITLGVVFAATWPRPALTQTPIATIQSFNVPPGSLAGALDVLAFQGRLQIMYSPDLVSGVTSRALAGRFTAQEALQQLLAGTGLRWEAVGPSTFLLLRQASPIGKRVEAVSKSSTHAVRTLGTITISGSLINNPEIQTATPVYTITEDVIRARGFNSIAEALQNSIFAMGSVQGPQHMASFTQGAQTINIGGLGPTLTLVLLDGKPLADFGRLYEGSGSFTNLSNIPLSLVDHIDIMPGGGSSIYGSQAVAGVINIVTKQQMDGGAVSVQAGRFTDGGGANQRVSMTYGHTFNKLNVFTGLEFDNASPIWGYQRALTASTLANPNGLDTPAIESAIGDFGTAASFNRLLHGYISPPQGCTSSLFGGTTQLAVNKSKPGLYGQYCGTRTQYGLTTFSNQARSIGGTVKFRYNVNEALWIYTNAMAGWQRQKWYPGMPLWLSEYLPGTLIEDANTRHILVFEKVFSPEEMLGGVAGQMNQQNDLLYQFNLGANGQFAASNWTWDIYYLRTGDRTTQTRNDLMTAPINAFFLRMLGPPAGIDPSTGLVAYHPDYAAFFRPIAPSQYAGFTRNISEFSQSWINETRATITNTELFDLPGGSAGFAAIAETGSEAWYAPVDPLFSSHAVYLYSSNQGGGQRAHSATAFELNLPILKQVMLDLSGRYDYYASHNASNNHKFTYKVGIEYRPVDSLLLRGNYTTVFKAPDLPSVYLAPSGAFFAVVDPYGCAIEHVKNCAGNGGQFVPISLLASHTLQPLSARTWTAGIVWSPFERLSLGADYYHIDVQDEIITQDPNLLAQKDAQCLLGQEDSSSKACQALTNPVSGQVQRMGLGGRGPITGVEIYYANLAHETTESVAASVAYRALPSRFGKFTFQLDYNDLLRHDYQVAPGQPVIDLLVDPSKNYDFKSMAEGSVRWTSLGDHWSGTLYARRAGSSHNYAAISGNGYPAGSLPPWITFNWSLTYTPVRNLGMSLVIKNIANKMPPRDKTFDAFPYFNMDNYDMYGREVMLQIDMKLGSHAG